MTSKERVMGAFNRTGYDRIPIKHEGTPEINHMIMDHFGLTNMEQLMRVVGEDFRYIEPEYIGPDLRTFPDGSVEGVTFLRMENNKAVFKVQSGKYEFKSVVK